MDWFLSFSFLNFYLFIYLFSDWFQLGKSSCLSPFRFLVSWEVLDFKNTTNLKFCNSSTNMVLLDFFAAHCLSPKWVCDENTKASRPGGSPGHHPHVTALQPPDSRDPHCPASDFSHWPSWERDIKVVPHLFMHSLIDSCICPHLG